MEVMTILECLKILKLGSWLPTINRMCLNIQQYSRILDMWSQAQCINMTLDSNGWLRVSDEELAIDWDSQDNTST